MNFEGTRVLLVDDHKIIRKSVRLMLEGTAEFKVVGEAAESDAAWRAVCELTPEIILLDLDLPGEGGVSLIRRVQGAYPRIRILVFTSSLGFRSAREAMESGASGYLLKTTGHHELLQGFKAVRDGHHFLCSETTLAVAAGLAAGAPEVTVMQAHGLTEREQQVLRLLVEGLRNKDIADNLGISVKSVETYRSRMMKRLCVGSPAELVRFAIRVGLAKA